MNEVVNRTLNQLEKQHPIKILYACEAGSRAWGLASADSDFDVRFIYILPQSHYLRIDPVGMGGKRDVIEMPINESLDITGWELTKALRLFRKSNPSLLEWLHSDIVYQQKFSAIDRMKALIPSVVNPKACILHYVKMAKTNLRKCQKVNQATVKDILNVIRPILAAKWITAYRTFPPVDFSKLVEMLLSNGELKEAVELIVEQKLTGKAGAVNIDAIMIFAADEITKLETAAKTLDPAVSDCTEQLNSVFQCILEEAW